MEKYRKGIGLNAWIPSKESQKNNTMKSWMAVAMCIEYTHIYNICIVCIKWKMNKERATRTMVKIRIIIFVYSHYYYYGWLSPMARHECCKNACELEHWYTFWIHNFRAFILFFFFFFIFFFRKLFIALISNFQHQIISNFVELYCQ